MTDSNKCEVERGQDNRESMGGNGTRQQMLVEGLSGYRLHSPTRTFMDSIPLSMIRISQAAV